MNSRYLVLAFMLAGCVPPGTVGPSSGAPQPGDLIAGTGSGALVEREPDLCQAAVYQGYIDQPGTVVPTLGIGRDYRVVEFGGIVSQEYNPGRINFWLAPTGEIVRIGCG